MTKQHHYDRHNFRGRQKNHSEWFYGSLLWYNPIRDPQICQKNENGGSNNFIVSPETIGRCTGLKDMNEVWIYEGDIIKAWGNTLSEIKSAVVYENGSFGYKDNITFYAFSEYDFENNIVDFVDVVGNVYDNPELLEVR